MSASRTHGKQQGHLSTCGRCLDLRKYLVSRDGFEELSPKEFYVHVDSQRGC